MAPFDQQAALARLAAIGIHNIIDESIMPRDLPNPACPQRKRKVRDGPGRTLELEEFPGRLVKALINVIDFVKDHATVKELLLQETKLRKETPNAPSRYVIELLDIDANKVYRKATEERHEQRLRGELPPAPSRSNRPGQVERALNRMGLAPEFTEGGQHDLVMDFDPTTAPNVAKRVRFYPLRISNDDGPEGRSTTPTQDFEGFFEPQIRSSTEAIGIIVESPNHPMYAFSYQQTARLAKDLKHLVNASARADRLMVPVTRKGRDELWRSMEQAGGALEGVLSENPGEVAQASGERSLRWDEARVSFDKALADLDRHMFALESRRRLDTLRPVSGLVLSDELKKKFTAVFPYMNVPPADGDDQDA
ncbi:hypothetical protein HDK90DRAFT_510179 [Phyllosticta capitalensis]|uniref:Uncharacterized protein n=1 Tax=Phyllosticta capitalensis TaxID=121624 RepID=A0ABR1YU86_9PEZI